MCSTEQSIAQFVDRFGREPECLAHAPGRVTVIGGHTDYNGGLVVSAPLGVGTTVSLGKNDKNAVRLISDQQPKPVELRVGELADDPASFWTRYIVGVLREIGCGETGLDVGVCSDLPMRRGMASSGALTAATALAASELIGKQLSPLELALLCQRAEQAYAGISCGLLDPYTALHAVDGQPLLIDCATTSHVRVNLPPELVFVACDSGADRQLAKSLYNVRRAECRLVAEALGRSSLRGVTLAELDGLREQLPVQARRAEHVIREIGRVEQFCLALAACNYPRVKDLMYKSHQSCRELFECSHPALDALVDRAIAHPGCVGARLTGAGWGGATVNLVFKDELKSFCNDVLTNQQSITR